MENTRSKRRISSFSRSSKILSSFYKPASHGHHGHKSNSKPIPPIINPSPKHTAISPSPAPPSMATGFIIVNKDQLVYPQQTPKVGYVVPDRNRHDYCAKLESTFYGGLVEDEAVDAKAAKYITDVQKRFLAA